MAAELGMKRRFSNQRTGGLTLVEVLISILMVAVMAGVFVPMLQPRRRGGCGGNCLSNLKQIGLACRMFSGDHDEKFPWAVSTTEGGTLEFANTTEVFRHYVALSNELSSPKVIVCRSDRRAIKASSWDTVTNNKSSLSYFVGLDADENRPQTILSGDRNLMTNGRRAWGLVTITTNTVLGITAQLHSNKMNVGLADGSAQGVAPGGLQRLNDSQLGTITNHSVRLAIP